ncbi:DNA helicase IV [Friedmanniella endophytica]|uniref:DNA helicase IV n=1 Tax=Microlunatus kandeliicorticis TaxID=1759536 RepID=A0A7W3ISB8_9ACTN|nr:UvrD-helicase domain-containing protein [Microlunatus kandeliicorticis]MBA8794329.1 DNA helicase IV [Microlunatus kandeliicorticis]
MDTPPTDSPAAPDGVSPDVFERELAAEQAHVDLVYARLAEATRSARQVANQGRALYQSDRQTVVREEDGTGLFERDVFAFQAARRLATLDAEHEGLVFGRLDRTDDEIRYVGRIGVRDADYEPLVIDWRAPAAEPFYRATPANPMEVVRRRVLRCRGVRVVGIEDDLIDSEAADDDLVVIGDGALLAALSRARGHTMRDIVATIQAEQDEAIRAPYQGVTLITGGPGTGKTVVALHRAAYLLYSNRRRFESGGVLVVGPSRLFMNYIERVLPSLGEEAVTLRSVGSVASDVVDLTGERHDSAEVERIKGGLAMVDVLARLVARPPTGSPTELRLLVKGEPITLRAEQLSRIRREVLAHNRVNTGRAAAETALLTALWRAKPADVDLDREAFDDLVTDLAAYKMFCHAWWPHLSPTDALARLADPATAAELTAGLLDPADAALLAQSLREADLARGGEPSVADGALLDELADRLGPLPEVEEEAPLFLEDGRQVEEVVTTLDRMAPIREADPFADPYTTYAHVLVDEAQDISPMQWRMLRRRGQRASWTIVGDLAQSSWPDPEEARRAIEQTIGSAPRREFRMSTNYRSPAEVFTLASQVVTAVYPTADLPTAVRSTGIDPLLRVAPAPDRLAEEVLAATREVLGQVEGTVGVIAAPDRARGLSELLADELDGEDATRATVVLPLQAKGLEYDAVVVVDPDEIVATSPGGVRVLYVALTRPTQRLVTVDANPGAAWRRSLGSPATG